MPQTRTESDLTCDGETLLQHLLIILADIGAISNLSIVK